MFCWVSLMQLPWQPRRRSTRSLKMVGGCASARSIIHLARLFILADRAVKRMRRVLTMAGITT